MTSNVTTRLLKLVTQTELCGLVVEKELVDTDVTIHLINIFQINMGMLAMQYDANGTFLFVMLMVVESFVFQ